VIEKVQLGDECGRRQYCGRGRDTHDVSLRRRLEIDAVQRENGVFKVSADRLTDDVSGVEVGPAATTTVATAAIRSFAFRSHR
jgi:hypothetical protein